MKFEAVLRGVNFRPIEAKSLVMSMQEGHALTLQRDGANQYDPNAIMVIDPETQIFIGFVAKEVAAEIAPLMDEGTEFYCRTGDRLSQNSFILLIDDEPDETEVDDEQSRGEETSYLDN